MSLLYIFLALVFVFGCRIIQLWRNAKPKHRSEWVDVLFVFGRWHMRTGVSIPRAFDPLLDVFNRRYWGLTFPCVQVIVYNHLGMFLVGHRDSGSRWWWDLGASGMNPFDLSALECAEAELWEELGFKGDLKKVGVLYPCDGMTCLMNVYTVQVPFDVVPRSTDGTYDEISYKHLESLHEFFREESMDALPGTKSDTFPILDMLARLRQR